MLAYTIYEFDSRVKRYAETLAKRGDHVDVIALKQNGQADYAKINNVNLYRIQKRVINERSKLSYLFKIVFFLINSLIFLSIRHLRNQYNLIHVHSVPDFEVFAAIIPKITGSKIILDIHDIVPEFYASKFNAKKDSIIYKSLILLEKISINFSDHVIISNDIWEKKLLSRSVNKVKCSTMLNYPDPFIFYFHQRKRDNNKFIFIYPGTLSWHQGVDVAVQAMAIIKDQAPQVEFHIYGEGPEKKVLQKLVSDLGLNDTVFFKGLLPSEEMANMMTESDIGVVPKRAISFGNEAFSTKILEFMALGIPVLVSNTKIDQYYFDESLVKFFESDSEKDLAKNILLLIKDKELREQLITNSLKYIEENNWGVKKNLYIELVDSLTEKHKKS